MTEPDQWDAVLSRVTGTIYRGTERISRGGVSPIVSRREEWQEQVKLSSLLDKWLDHTCAFATATDPVASSAKSGAMRKKRGVKAGLPDTWGLHRGKLVTLELKSAQGRCSASQRATREALRRAGAEWWECRSAHAAMWALRKSGVRFRTLIHALAAAPARALGGAAP